MIRRRRLARRRKKALGSGHQKSMLMTRIESRLFRVRRASDITQLEDIQSRHGRLNMGFHITERRAALEAAEGCERKGSERIEH